VRENRRRVGAALGVAPGNLLTGYQIHSATAIAVTAPWPDDARPRADALATDRPGLALGVLSADCAPVLLADPEAGVIGAAHAGWRGALAGITDAVIGVMETLGAQRRRIRAAVGPCISQAWYEVGAELRQAFLDAAIDNDALFTPARRPDHFQFDLEGYVASRLSGAEIGAVERLGRCTYADEDAFFSFRRATHRGEPDYGRAISAIALASDPGVA
jgi:YfiH family protein